jgi:DNA-binding CsgD family transcriptional regulator
MPLVHGVGMGVNELRNQDLREVLFISRIALECTTPDELICQVLSQLEPIFKTNSLNFYYASRSSQKLNLKGAVGRGIEDKYFIQFRDYYHRLDPFFKIWLANPNQTIITDQLAHLKNLTSSEYYNDFFRPQSIHHQMSIYLKRKSRLLGVFSLFRPQSASHFSSRDLAKANLMASYLTSSLKQALTTRTMAEQGSIIDSMVTEIPYEGVLVLDASLEAIYQNESALIIMSNLNESEGGREIHQGLIPMEIYLRCREFLRSSRQDETSVLNHRQFDIISPVDNQKISINLHLIASPKKDPLLVVYLEPERKRLDMTKCKQQFCLSQRELEVVSLLANGLTNKEIGEKLFISEYTVENHLRSIYRKMDVNNRTSVVHLLLQMALAN